MALDTGQFRQHDPDNLGPLGNLIGNAEKLLNRQHITQVIMHGSQIVQAVGQGNDLMVGAVFGELLRPTVKKTDMGSGLGDDLAVQFKDKLEHPVGRRMLGPHIHGHCFGK